MTELKPTTKKALDIIDTWGRCRNDHVSIFGAYKTTASYAKQAAYNEIKKRAMETNGYNHDLTVCAAGSFTFSTIYSYTDGEGTHIVKDTPSYTYLVTI